MNGGRAKSQLERMAASSIPSRAGNSHARTNHHWFPRETTRGTSAKNITLISVTTPMWVVPPIGRTATSTNQKHIPDASSVSNFFASSSDRSFRGESSGVTADCHPNRNSLYHSFNSFISLLHIAFYYLYNIFHRSKLNALYQNTESTIRLTDITKQNISAFK